MTKCIYTIHCVTKKKLAHQADVDNFVNSQWNFTILLLAHSVDNLL